MYMNTIILMITFSIIALALIITIIINNKKEQKKKQLKTQELENKHSDIIEKYYNILVKDPTINEKRAHCQKNKKLGMIFVIIGFLSFVFITPISMVLIICGIIKLNNNIKDYNNHYKEIVIKPALKEYNSNLTYYPTGCIPEEIYRQAKFENYDRYSSEDRINGIINGNQFMMADVNAEDKRTDSDGNTYYVTLFKGPVVIINIPEIINFNLAIINNRIASHHNGLPKIEIDNPIFEEIYDVYSDNQILAMRILTPAITNKILDLYKKYDFKFELKIVNNALYFRFHSGELFVPNYTNPRQEAISIALYFEILNGIEEMTSEFIKTIAFLRNK